MILLVMNITFKKPVTLSDISYIIRRNPKTLLIKKVANFILIDSKPKNINQICFCI